MRENNSAVILAALLMLIGPAAIADEQRAKANYMLNCQGCHTADGSGHQGRNIPTLKNYMGKFLKVEGGREFLIQVPGASQALLSSEQLAELTNWMLREFDPKSLKDNFIPYQTQEVHQLRQHKVIDFTPVRNALVKKIELLP